VKEYRLIHEPTIEIFETEVNRAILNGWECQGGVVCYIYSNYTGATPRQAFLQAMTRDFPVSKDNVWSCF
jgi:hypothetical protein